VLITDPETLVVAINVPEELDLGEEPEPSTDEEAPAEEAEEAAE
jgi:hypothetical protein